LPRSDAFRLTEFIALPTLLWHIRQFLCWFLSVQLRSDVQHVCAALPRSDAFRLTEFIAFPTLLWHIRQLLFWFLSVQLRSDVHRLLLTCRDLMLFG
jgi:predicted transposase YbfD/YdcC